MTDFESINQKNAVKKSRLLSPENDESASVLLIIEEAIKNNIFEKAVFSKPNDKNVRKTILTLFIGNCNKDKKDKYPEEGPSVMLETFKNDGKVFHHNAGFSYLGSILENLMIENRQCDIITTCGICTAMVSKKGKVHISNNITYGITSEKSKISEHNRAKNHLLSPEAPFLYPLGITDRNGRILDKRRSKYKQINRFLEMVDDVYNELPKNGDLTVCDLCCGKSILAFAVYWYLSEYRKREIRMYGVDLKQDVINLETEIAVRLNYRGMHFICEDVEKFVPPEKPSMILSLHACDTATDLVLSLAVKYGADVILSTPCCHHEIFHQTARVPDELSAAFDGRSILRQKFADALTDGLRAARLEMEGYTVSTAELVDPDDTPKNVLLREVKNKKLSDEEKSLLRRKYDKCCEFFGISPSLDKLI